MSVDRGGGAYRERQLWIENVKMDNRENMGNARYTTNDDTAVFINQIKNRSTSRKTKHDKKLIKKYVASIGEIRNVDGIIVV